MKISIIALMLVLLAGCSLPFKNGKGTTYHLIIGAGLVTTHSNDTNAVIATRTKALGVSVSDQPGTKLAVGYSSSKVVSVAEGNNNVLVEIEDNANGDLVAKVDQCDIPLEEGAYDVE